MPARSARHATSVDEGRRLRVAARGLADNTVATPRVLSSSSPLRLVVRAFAPDSSPCGRPLAATRAKATAFRVSTGGGGDGGGVER